MNFRNYFFNNILLESIKEAEPFVQQGKYLEKF